jgi:Ca-activated chloride channel homolog
VKVAAAVVLALTTAAATLSGQAGEPQSQQQGNVFRSGSSLVALNVSVQDDGQKYVGGLQSADFAVFEDGVKQNVQFFESTAVPIDLIVLIDQSSSMNDKLDVVHEAASGFLKTLREGDRGAVVGFADGVTVLQPLTADRGLLEQAVRTTTAKGSTALNNAVYIALKQFGQSAHADAAVRRQAIVVLSDGEDTSSLVTFDDVLALARKAGVNIYTVGLQSKVALREPVTRKYFSDADLAMKMLARETGALAFFPQPGELKAVYGSIASELASQYSIGYVPANARSDGRFRRIVVQVVTRPALHPRTRQGYTPDAVGTSALSLSAGGGDQRDERR